MQFVFYILLSGREAGKLIPRFTHANCNFAEIMNEVFETYIENVGFVRVKLGGLL